MGLLGSVQRTNREWSNAIRGLTDSIKHHLHTDKELSDIVRTLKFLGP